MAVTPPTMRSVVVIVIVVYPNTAAPMSMAVTMLGALPHYENRATAARVMARQFNGLLEETQLKMDTGLQTERTIYSLRHTAICMRIILSHGKAPAWNRLSASTLSVCLSRVRWR
jgi:hypothetical protein